MFIKLSKMQNTTSGPSGLSLCGILLIGPKTFCTYCVSCWTSGMFLRATMWGCAGEQYPGYLCNAQLPLLQVSLTLLEIKSGDV